MVSSLSPHSEIILLQAIAKYRPVGKLKKLRQYKLSYLFVSYLLHGTSINPSISLYLSFYEYSIFCLSLSLPLKGVHRHFLMLNVLRYFLSNNPTTSTADVTTGTATQPPASSSSSISVADIWEYLHSLYDLDMLNVKVIKQSSPSPSQSHPI